MTEESEREGMDVEALGEHEFEILCRDLVRALGAGAGGRVVAVSKTHRRPTSAEEWWRVARAVTRRLPTNVGADLLGALLQRPEPHLVEAAARALAAIAPQVGKERVVAALLPLVTSGEPARERAGIRALGQVGHASALRALTQATRSRDRATRYAAYAALACIDSPKARRWLVSSLAPLSPRRLEVLTALLYPGAPQLEMPPRQMLGQPWSGFLGLRMPGMLTPAAACQWLRGILSREAAKTGTAD
jgi:hypothetical protein